MKAVAAATRKAVNKHSQMVVFERARLNDLYGEATGNYGTHRPAWVVDTLWYYLLVVLNSTMREPVLGDDVYGLVPYELPDSEKAENWRCWMGCDELPRK